MKRASLTVIFACAKKLPAAFIRKAPKEYGPCKYAEGPDLPGKSLLLVEDVVSSGPAYACLACGWIAPGIPEAFRVLRQEMKTVRLPVRLPKASAG